MPVTRKFRGREIDRTARKGDQVEIVYRNSVPGLDKDRETVPLAVYTREVEKSFRPAGQAR